MDATREQLLTGPRLPNEQNRNAATGCHLGRQCDYFAERRALPDYVRVPSVRRRELRSG
jgi:hypothetical protein